MTKENFFDYVTSLLHTIKKPINILLVTCKKPLIQELTEWNPKYFDVKVDGDDEIFSIDITRLMANQFSHIEDPRRVRVEARIIKYGKMPIYMIFSDCNKSDFKNVITKLMQKHYPDVSKLFLTNKEIEKIVVKLEEKTGNEIIVENYSIKERLFGKHKKVKSVTSSTEEYHSDFFADVARTNSWINSIRLTAKITKNIDGEEISMSTFSGVIARECFFAVTRNFVPFLESVIPSAIDFAYKRNQYLSIRSEILQKKENVEPIVIKFKDAPFSDISENKNFVEAFLALEKFSVSSFHTNPYIQISLLDYLDGSSYDLWVVSQDRLVIYPQSSASTASMSRVVNHVFERIKEGVVENFAEIQL